jgi:hypothetical protein
MLIELGIEWRIVMWNEVKKKHSKSCYYDLSSFRLYLLPTESIIIHIFPICKKIHRENLGTKNFKTEKNILYFLNDNFAKPSIYTIFHQRRVDWLRLATASELRHIFSKKIKIELEKKGLRRGQARVGNVPIIVTNATDGDPPPPLFFKFLSCPPPLFFCFAWPFLRK